MSMDRRSWLKVLSGAGLSALAGPALAEAAEGRPDGELYSMLYDATLCIGCQACTVACREANGLAYEAGTTLWDAPVDLSCRTKSVIREYAGPEGESFVKSQCMHCLDPACVSACMFGALNKVEGGIVAWEGDRCVGCRYCQIGCPYNVPRFEWESRNPQIVKCELCRERLAEGGVPACVEVCPREAIVFGTREELLEEAWRRIAAEPGRYLPHVYGEHEAGGAQVLYLSHLPFQALGLPALDEESLPHRVHRVQGTIYKGFVAPVALLGVVGALVSRNLRRGDEEPHE